MIRGHHPQIRVIIRQTKSVLKNILLHELYNKQRDRVMVYDNGPLYAFFISNTFISNATLKSARNQADAKQHHEAEHFVLILFQSLAEAKLFW